MHLQPIQLLSQLDDGGALSRQVLAHIACGLSGRLEGIQSRAVVAKCSFKLRNLRAIAGTERGFERVQTTDGGIQLLESGLLVFSSGLAV